MQEIADGIVVSTEFRRITVGAIATGKGIICIDVPPFPSEARLWRSTLMERYKQPISLVILTDANPDRLPGLYWFDEAHIVSHDSVYKTLKTLPASIIEHTADGLADNSEERVAFSGVRLRLPRITFSDRMTAFVGDFGVPLLWMPGPTPGNIWAHLHDQHIVFTGDSVVMGRAPHMKRTMSKEWLNSLTELRRSRFVADIVVPGRGPLTDKDSTHAVSDFVRYARRRVHNLIRAERPRGEVVEILPGLLEMVGETDERYEHIKVRLMAGLEAIYDEFVAEFEEDLEPEPEPENEDEELAAR